jgi:hypothetical protein
MTTTSKPLHRTIASLKLPTKVPALITYAQGIVKGMTANPSFPSPTPSLATVTQQYSADGGKTWISVPSTLQAKTTVSGMTPGATALFRYRAVTKTGEGDWSQPTALLVR